MPREVSPSQARDREIRVWAFACRGWTERAIAAELQLSPAGVHKILKRIITRELKRVEGEVAARRVTHTAFLETARSEAFAAWERSKEATRKSRRQTTTIPPPQLNLEDFTDGKAIPANLVQKDPITVREVTTKEAEESDGEIAYLNAAVSYDAELRKLWGVNAPKQIDLVDKRRPLEKLTDDELRARMREADALLAADGKDSDK